MMIHPGHNSDTAPLANLLANRMWQRRRIVELERERDRLEAILAARSVIDTGNPDAPDT